MLSQLGFSVLGGMAGCALGLLPSRFVALISMLAADVSVLQLLRNPSSHFSVKRTWATLMCAFPPISKYVFLCCKAGLRLWKEFHLFYELIQGELQSLVIWRFLCCDKTPGPKATWGGKCLFHLTASSWPCREVRARPQDGNLAETDAELMEVHCWLACSRDLLGLLSYPLLDHKPVGELGLPPTVTS